MRIALCALLVVLMVGVLVGCPSMWPFGKPDAPPVVTDITEPSTPQPPPEQAAQKWLVWGIPVLGLLALIGLALGLYLKNNLAMYGAGVCGAGLLVDIGLLTYWKVIAVVVLVVILAAVAGGLTLAALWLAKHLSLNKKLLTSLQDGVDRAKVSLAKVGAMVPKDLLVKSLAAAQLEAGMQEEMDKSRGKDPEERNWPGDNDTGGGVATPPGNEA